MIIIHSTASSKTYLWLIKTESLIIGNDVKTFGAKLEVSLGQGIGGSGRCQLNASVRNRFVG